MNLISGLDLGSLLDLSILGILTWRVVTMVKGTRAMSIFWGLVILGLTYVLSSLLKLHFTHQLLSYFFDHLILIVILLFQEEIRRTLASVGRKAPGFASGRHRAAPKESAVAIASVAAQMAKEFIGGLIVLEREDKLGNIMESGEQVYSQVSAPLLYAIFKPGSPLHDGAVIISKGEIASAGCFLPLTKSTSLEKSYGTRHRAAIGLTEETDAVVVLISEEAGAIHLVKNGKLNKNLTETELKDALLVLQAPEERQGLWTKVVAAWKKIRKK